MNAYLPPLVIDVRVREHNDKHFRIWLPFFLLWPLLFVIVGFVVLVTLLVDLALVVVGARYHRYTQLVLTTMQLLAQIRGTHVNALSNGSRIKVDIY